MDIKDELKEKIEGFMNGKINKDELYNWVLDVMMGNKVEAPEKLFDEPLLGYIFGDLIELNCPEWCDLTPEKIKYYYDCLTGKEIFDKAKADSLSKKIFEKNGLKSEETKGKETGSDSKTKN